MSGSTAINTPAGLDQEERRLAAAMAEDQIMQDIETAASAGSTTGSTTGSALPAAAASASAASASASSAPPAGSTAGSITGSGEDTRTPEERAEYVLSFYAYGVFYC